MKQNGNIGGFKYSLKENKNKDDEDDEDEDDN